MTTLEKQIIEMRRQGISYRAIQRELHVSFSTISDIEKAYNGDQQVSQTDLGKITVPVSNSLVQEASNPEISIRKKTNPFVNTSNLDAKTILEINKDNIKHEEEMKKLELTDKERDRLFKKEMEDKQIEKINLQTRQDEARVKAIELKGKLLQDKENENEPEYEDEYEEDSEQSENDTEPDGTDIDPDFYSDLETYINYLLENNDNARCSKEDVADELKKIRSLKKRFKKMMDYEGNEVDDYTEWEILIYAENLFKQLRKEIAASIWNKIRFVLENELKSMLDEYLEE